MDDCCSVPWQNTSHDVYASPRTSTRQTLRTLLEEMRSRFTDENFQEKSCNSLAVIYKNKVTEERGSLHKMIAKQVVKAMRFYKKNRELVTSALYAFGAIFQAVPELRRAILPSSSVDLILSMMESFENNCGVQVAGFHAVCSVVTIITRSPEKQILKEAWLIPVVKAGEQHERCSRVRIWCLHTLVLLIPEMKGKDWTMRYRIIDLVIQYFRSSNHHTPTLVHGWQVFESLLGMYKSLCEYFVRINGLKCLYAHTTTLKHIHKIQMSYIHILDVLSEASIHYPGIYLSWTSILLEVVTAMEAYPYDMDIYPLGVKSCHSALVVRASGRKGLPCISNRLINVLLMAMSCAGPESLDMRTLACEVIYSIILRCNSTLHHFIVSNGVDRVLASVADFTTLCRLHKAARDVLVTVFKSPRVPLAGGRWIELGFDIIKFEIKNVDIAVEILEYIRQNMANGSSGAALQRKKCLRIASEFMHANSEALTVHSSLYRFLRDWCLAENVNGS